MEEDPYKAPEVAEVEAESVISDPERIRRVHLKHEASLKGAGMLMILGAFLVGVSMLTGMVFSGSGISALGGFEVAVMAVVGVLLVLQVVAGVGLRKLSPSSWIPALIVSGFALINIPIGTVIGGYFLYLLLAPKGRRILSVDYREVVRQTPHIRYRTPVWLWLLLLVLVLVVVGSLVWFSIG